MKTKFFIFSVFILTSFAAKAQQYIPFPDSNAVWGIEYGCFDVTQCPNGDIVRWQYYISKDTVIGPHNYIKINSRITSPSTTGCCALGMPYLTCFLLRSDTLSRKVYLLECDSTNEKLLYNFSMNIGDTLKGFLSLQDQGLIHTLYSIDSVLINGNYRKMYHFELNQIPPTLCDIDYIIEGIGGIAGLIEPISFAESSSSTLLCYSENGNVIYTPGDAFPTCGGSVSNIWCDPTVSITDFNNIINNISIYPNPSFGSFTIEINNNIKFPVIAQIYHSLGIKLFEIELKNSINTINLPFLGEGFYFLKLKTEDYLFTNKIIIK